MGLFKPRSIEVQMPQSREQVLHLLAQHGQVEADNFIISDLDRHVAVITGTFQETQTGTRLVFNISPSRDHLITTWAWIIFILFFVLIGVGHEIRLHYFSYWVLAIAGIGLAGLIGSLLLYNHAVQKALHWIKTVVVCQLG